MESLTEILSFIKSAELNSFSAASRALGSTPGVVSKHIGKLEQDLGVRLFTRSTRRIVLTDKGREFLELCQNPVLEIQNAVRQLKESTTELKGLLRVCSSTDYGRRFLLPILEQFQLLHPKLSVELVLDDHFSNLIADNFDVGIRISPKLADTSMVSRKIQNIELVTCASPEYFSKYGKPSSLDDLMSHKLIAIKLPSTGRTLNWEFVKANKSIVIEVKAFAATNDPEALRQMALDGHGIIQTGSHSVAGDVKNGKLKPLFSSMTVRRWSVYVYYPHRSFLAPKVRSFVDYLIANKPQTSTRPAYLVQG